MKTARTAIRIANMHLFKKDCLIVGVEGPDDVSFWSSILPESFRGHNLEILPAHGSDALLQAFARVQAGKTKRTICAMDSEYDAIIGDKPRHRLLVKTVRHSTENYLYDPVVIDAVTSIFCRSAESCVSFGESWAEEIANEFRELVYIDCASIRFRAGVRVLGDNATAFLRNKGHRPSKTKINAKLRCVRKDITVDQLEHVKRLFGERPIFPYIRGHFLTSAVRRRIQAEVQKRRKTKHFNLPDTNLLPVFLPQFIAHSKIIPDAVLLRRRAQRALALALL